jgi:hypothetical protein
MQGFATANLLHLTIVTFVVGVRLLLVAHRTHRLPELLFGVASCPAAWALRRHAEAGSAQSA